MKRAVVILLAFVGACANSTEPKNEPAAIIFRSACPGERVYNLLIDGQTVDERAMVLGDSAKFSVEPGSHTAGAVSGEGMVVNIWYPQSVTLMANQRYVQTLGCS
jgi:hypothetical protein